MKISKSKKLKKNKKKKISICILIIIVIISLLFLILSLTKNRDVDFKVINRINQLNKSKSEDKYDYETIGWLRVEGTKIDYPIIFDNSNKYTNPIEKVAYGWLNSDDSSYKNNLTVDGHNVFNLGVPKKTSPLFSRFEELLAYTYYDFATENQFIQLTMNGKNYLYQVFAVTYLYNADFNSLPYEQATKKEQQEQIDFLREQSIYDYKIDVNSNDKILNVATCTRIFGVDEETNFVVSAKLIKNEKLKYNRVVKNKNYKRVDNKLKGSDENDPKDI